MSNESNSKPDPLLIGAGIFAMLWTIARACVQSITIDEADTYLAWVSPPLATQWNPNANNHVLNSLLERLTLTIFPAGELTLRIPALIGAALYLIAVYRLVPLIAEGRWLRRGLFVCLTCSPFVMDYLVAARGYGLASAFLLWMVTIAAWHQAQDPKVQALTLRRTCALISICGALSISANFSFAVADVMLGAALFVWIARQHGWRTVLQWFTLPGLAVGYFLVGSVVLAWPKGQFVWGADSLWKMIKSLVSASLFEPDNYLLNPRLHHYFVHFGTFLYPLLAAFVLWRLVMMVIKRRECPVAVICGCALVAALAVHEVLFHVYGILLPLDRTAMWVMLLFLVMAGALAPGTGISGKALRPVLMLIACYNLGCLRLTYFNEWKYDAGMKEVYAILARYNHQYGLTKVSVNWRYLASLNCYRLMSGKETIEEIPAAPGVVNFYPPGYQAYVIYYPGDKGFYQQEGLKLIYHDPLSEVAVAIRPEVESGGK